MVIHIGSDVGSPAVRTCLGVECLNGGMVDRSVLVSGGGIAGSTAA